MPNPPELRWTRPEVVNHIGEYLAAAWLSGYRGTWGFQWLALVVTEMLRAAEFDLNSQALAELLPIDRREEVRLRGGDLSDRVLAELVERVERADRRVRMLMLETVAVAMRKRADAILDDASKRQAKVDDETMGEALTRAAFVALGMPKTKAQGVFRVRKP